MDALRLGDRVEHFLAEVEAEVAVLQQKPLPGCHGLRQQPACVRFLPLAHGNRADFCVKNKLRKRGLMMVSGSRVLSDGICVYLSVCLG